jgi:addiction module HigA family antidote
MMKKIYKKIERTPSHAGEILKSGFIDQYELSIVTVSDLLGITREHLSRIINGHAPVTSDIAAKLEILTKTPASQWLAIQAKYDSYIMEQNAYFKKYKETLEEWATDSLSLMPGERRKDKKTMALVAQASELTRHFSRKSKLA